MSKKDKLIQKRDEILVKFYLGSNQPDMAVKYGAKVNQELIEAYIEAYIERAKKYPNEAENLLSKAVDIFVELKLIEDSDIREKIYSGCMENASAWLLLREDLLKLFSADKQEKISGAIDGLIIDSVDNGILDHLVLVYDNFSSYIDLDLVAENYIKFGQLDEAKRVYKKLGKEVPYDLVIKEGKYAAYEDENILLALKLFKYAKDLSQLHLLLDHAITRSTDSDCEEIAMAIAELES